MLAMPAGVAKLNPGDPYQRASKFHPLVFEPNRRYKFKTRNWSSQQGRCRLCSCQVLARLHPALKSKRSGGVSAHVLQSRGERESLRLMSSAIRYPRLVVWDMLLGDIDEPCDRVQHLSFVLMLYVVDDETRWCRLVDGMRTTEPISIQRYRAVNIRLGCSVARV
ncbi:hypothetical protein BDR05DRAFT_357609 [Suillus weaverae]|nr:hypothetical protein BDR05DRAFT_357609 [Suillus weaverae]